MSSNDTDEKPAGTSWRSLLMVLLVAAAVVVAADLALHVIYRPIHRREVGDAVREYRTADPTTLVVGSSHARTFAAMTPVLRERTAGREELLSVSLEAGRFTSYLWVLEHRLLPFIEERSSDGRLKRTRLRRFILLTNWWDATRRITDQPYSNLPTHAWELGDFLEDVARSGLNGHNRNYLGSWLQEIGWHSVLINMRGSYHQASAFRDFFIPPTPEQLQERFEHRVARARDIMEGSKDAQLFPEEMQAMGRILDLAQQHGLETTVVLFPIAPSTQDERLRSLLITPSHRAICRAATERGVPCIDQSLDHPMVDGEFMADLDHLNPTGDLKYVDWALDGELSFLLHPPSAPPAVGR